MNEEETRLEQENSQPDAQDKENSEIATLNPPEIEGEGQENGSSDAKSVKPNDEELTAVYEVPVQVSAVLGRATLPVNQLLKLGRGAVIELDRKVGEAVDIFVNNRLVARGEVVVVDEHLGITMTEIIKADRA